MHKDKNVKKSARGDNRRYIEKKARSPEETVRKGGAKTVYRLIYEIKRRIPNISSHAKDENVKVHIEAE